VIWLVAALLLVAVAAYLVWPLFRSPRAGEQREVELVSPTEPDDELDELVSPTEPDDELDELAPQGRPEAGGKGKAVAPSVQPEAALAGAKGAEIEEEIAEMRRALKQARFCSCCGGRAGPGDSYCSRCGAPLKGRKA
jgi:hypothetical protein